MLYSISRLFARCLLVFAGASLPLSSALAQPSGAQGDDFLYRAVQNDTLSNIAATYTTNGQNWRTLQSLNNIPDPRTLPIGKMLRIPFAMIPQVPGNAAVIHVAGEAWLDREPLHAGDSVAEGGAIRTGDTGFVTLRLSDGSTLTIPSNASVAVQRLRVFQNVPLTDTIISIDKGSLESQVAPQNTGVGRFEVRTPVSITGVRGTRLRVHASTDGARSEVIEGAAQLESGSSDSARLAANQGAAVSPEGRMLGVRTLLPAPQLPEIPPSDHSGRLSFPAVGGASSYLIRIATDPEGRQLIDSRSTEQPSATYSRSGSERYLLVRAIDSNGIGGHDGMTTIPAGRVLLTSNGTAVRSGDSGVIRLIDY